MEHLTDTQIAEFRRGTLPAPVLLEADGHLQHCSHCRRKLLDASPGADAAALWEHLGDDHLSYEQLEAYADGTSPAEERTRIAGHLEVCPECRADAGDLSELHTQLAVPNRRPTLWRPWAAAAAVVLMMGAATWWWKKSAEEIPAQYAHLMTTALRTGSVEIAPRISELRTSAGVLRGDSRIESFRVESPLGTAVSESVPVFRWTAAAPDASYEVRVFDADLVPVAESGELTKTEWTPDKPLARGQMYRWQVTAKAGGKILQAPGAASSEARFFVLEQASVDEIEAARRVNNSLALGLVYARTGVVDLAERELSAYAAAHPTQQARALLAAFHREVGR